MEWRNDDRMDFTYIIDNFIGVFLITNKKEKNNEEHKRSIIVITAWCFELN